MIPSRPLPFLCVLNLPDQDGGRIPDVPAALPLPDPRYSLAFFIISAVGSCSLSRNSLDRLATD